MGIFRGNSRLRQTHLFTGSSAVQVDRMTPSKPKRVLEVVMKTCPVCGLDVEDSYLYCPDDGASLNEALPEGVGFSSELAAGEPATAREPHTAREPAIVGEPAVVGEPAIVEPGPSMNEAVVMYCGECAAEYPMTFAECPVHHAALTRNRLQTIADQVNDPVEPSAAEPRFETEARLLNSAEDISPRFISPDDVPRLETEEPVLKSKVNSPLFVSHSDAPRLETEARLLNSDRSGRLFMSHNEASSAERNIEYDGPLFVPQTETRSFRIVAAALVIALVLFCVAAVYIFFSAGARRQVIERASVPNASSDSAEPAFVPTPDSARAFEAQQTQPDTQAVVPPQNENAAAQAPSTHRQQTTGTELNTKSEPRPAPVSMNRTASGGSRAPSQVLNTTPRDSGLPRIDPGNLDARLIRVRSIRTASGVRYDLTFDLQDESGRHSQWERMSVQTRSGSGVSHTQTVPFVHRLGANGALTFTVSVEMRGHSETDLRGRVVCTTTGADVDGRPVRASFAANVTP